MEYQNLGNTGLQVSRLCLGCMTYGKPPAGQETGPGRHAWTLSADETAPFLKAAIDTGINFFDTANVYSSGASEEVLGDWISRNVPRESVVLATKVHGLMRPGPNGSGLSRKEILFELDQSLRRLKTDFVDLYQIHRWDPHTPIEETMEALHDCVRAGKVRYLGASSMYSWQFMKAQFVAKENGWTRFISMQNHYNLIYREEEREMVGACLDQGAGLIPWSPLARGRLARPLDAAPTKRLETDKFGQTMYSTTENADREVIRALQTLSRQQGKPMAALALAWLLSKPGVVSPIIGASKSGHLEDALQSLTLHLSPEDLHSLEAPYQAHPVLGFS